MAKKRKAKIDPIAAVCADLSAVINRALGKENLHRAMRWLEANRDADKWVENDVEMARGVIAFLRAIARGEGTPELKAIADQLTNPAIVLLQKRLVELPTVLRVAERFLPVLSLQAVLDRVLIEPWENGLGLPPIELDHPPDLN